MSPVVIVGLPVRRPARRDFPMIRGASAGYWYMAMRRPLTIRDLLWMVGVIIILLTWYLDRSALLKKIDLYELEIVSSHDRIDRLQREIDQRNQFQSTTTPPSSQDH